MVTDTDGRQSLKYLLFLADRGPSVRNSQWFWVDGKPQEQLGSAGATRMKELTVPEDGPQG